MTQPKMSRRGVLCGATALSALFVGRAFGATFAPTASETAGPFYPAVLPKESDNDLTKMAGHQPAKGQVIEILGRVLGPDGQPRKGAVVEIWQANAVGRYAHPSDPSKLPVDAGFQGWGKAITAADGRYRFVTIIPGAYPAAPGWTRPRTYTSKSHRSGRRHSPPRCTLHAPPN